MFACDACNPHRVSSRCGSPTVGPAIVAGILVSHRCASRDWCNYPQASRLFGFQRRIEAETFIADECWLRVPLTMPLRIPRLDGRIPLSLIGVQIVFGLGPSARNLRCHLLGQKLRASKIIRRRFQWSSSFFVEQFPESEIIGEHLETILSSTLAFKCCWHLKTTSAAGIK